MTKYTIEDVAHLIPVEQTESVKGAVEAYLNEGTIPPEDGCLSCEPAYVRKLISTIEVGKRHGLFPKQEATGGEDIPKPRKPAQRKRTTKKQ